MPWYGSRRSFTHSLPSCPASRVHLAYVYDYSSLAAKQYLNGVAMVEDANSYGSGTFNAWPSSLAPLDFGYVGASSAGNYLDCWMKDLRLYTVALR